MSLVSVKKEVAHNTLRDAREVLGLSDAEIGLVVGANRRTVQRWWKQHTAPAPEHQRQMERIREIVYLLRLLFRTPEAAQRWFHSPVPMLRDRTPVSLVQEGRGDEVISVLAGLASGAHA
jgi:putative toxin-antitoxin system antitoxin component (TIGR02293 family)